MEGDLSMGKALAACCLAMVLSVSAWAQEPPAAPAEPPAAEQTAPAPPEQATSPPAEQPTAPEQPAAAPEQPPVAAEQPAAGETAPAAPPAAAEQPGAVERGEAPAPQPGPEQGPPIVAIETRGNEHIPTDTVTAALTAHVGEAYTPALAEAQGKAVRDLGWFYDVSVTTEPAEQGVRLVVAVVENPVIKGLVIEGNTVFSDEQLLAVMETKPGQVSNNRTIIRDLQAIQRKYQDAGYIYAQVTDVATDATTGNLVISLVEGKVEEIRVTGNRKTKTYVVAREMGTKPGDILNREVLRRDLDRLINLEIFQDVSAQPTVGSAPGLVVVTINVVEKKTGLASAGLGYSSVQKLVGFVDLAESNLGGTGQQVTIRTEFGGRESYELGYYNPWIAAPATSLRVGLYRKLILREAFTQEKSFLYDEQRNGGNVTWSRPLGQSYNTRLFATVRADSVSVRQAEATELPEIIALQRGEDVRSLALAVRNDTRNIIANPTHGGLNSLSVEFAGWLGGADFGKFGSDLRRYWRVGGKTVFASRLMFGLATGNPPFLEQYLVGGGETLRGYRNDRFPGTHMALLNTELRIPLQENLAGVLFADVGDAWGGAFARDFGDTDFTAHLGYGVGVRLITPIGPIRIDYGIGSEGQETHFSVGHAF
jgi:outer membrane protein insertion porin family